MTGILIALACVSAAGWVQAERVIRYQRKALACSESVIACQAATIDELQETVHVVAKRDPDQQTLAAWGGQVH